MNLKKRLALAATAVLCVSVGGRGLCQTSPEFPEIPPYVLPGALNDWQAGEDPTFTRLFRTTTVRTVIPLNGFWDFVPDPRDRGMQAGYATNFPPPETRLWIPGTWNSYARYWHYEGAAWLQRTFQVPTGGLLRIRFAGVFYRSQVWLDGDLLGDHEGGYSPFEFVRRVTQGPHSLVVLADNRLSHETLPKAGADWFPYGGIHRPVYAEVVSDVYIDNFHVITASLTSREALLVVRAYLQNQSQRSVEANLAFEVNGHPAGSAQCELEPGDRKVEFEVRLERPILWSPSQPYLYGGRLILSIPVERPNGRTSSSQGQFSEKSSIVDDQITRFGLRRFTVSGSQILLNGEPLKLIGANRHDDHPEWGSALPPNTIRQDVEILKRLGANAVRTHYPPAEMFLDYCDEAGLLFMSEIPAWQYDYSQLTSPAVVEKIHQQFREMVYRDMNHPSVFSWSLGNEWRDFRKCYDILTRLIGYARGIDSTHFITYVTGGAEFGPASELLDLISTNWGRYEWYAPFTVLDEQEGREGTALLSRLHAAFPGKPVIVTEFGGAEAEAGWHNWGNVKWSEEFQARNVADSARYILEQPWIAGGCVWQFSDSRSTPSRFLAGRLRGWNGKGIVDAYRFPKLAFIKLQELFRRYRDLPMSGEGRATAASQDGWR